MTRPRDQNQNLKTDVLSDCVVIITYIEPTMIFSLLRLVRNETDDDVPYYAGTYSYEKYMGERFSDEMPYVYGSFRSDAPWLWRVPDEIVTELVCLETKKELQDLARAWKESDSDLKRLTLTVLKKMLADLQQASIEAARTKKKVFLYIST